MTANREFNDIARAWLDLMPSEAPDRVVDSVLQAVETAPQVRPSYADSRRLSKMTRFALAAAAAQIKLAGDVEIDVQNLSGRRGKESLTFTRREMEILEYLQRNTQRPVSRDELLTRVWGYDRSAEIETRTGGIATPIGNSRGPGPWGSA